MVKTGKINTFGCVISVMLCERSDYIRKILKEHYRKMGGMNKGRDCIGSPQVSRLSRALTKRGIRNTIEPLNGCRHSGISISWSKLNLKVSSRYNLEDPNGLFFLSESSNESLRNLTSTIKIPNKKIDNNLEELTDALANIAWKRYELLRLLKQP
jgi:hypothetical protein